MRSSRTFREGSVGLLALLGLVLFGGVVFWLRGGSFTKGSYNLIAEFTDVTGLKVGGPVRYRGVEVGRVQDIIPTDNGVDVIMTITSQGVRIPKSVEVRTARFGLIGDSAIDIVPQTSVPAAAESLSPLDEECLEADLILCDHDQLPGIESAELYASLTRLSEQYGDPALFAKINQTADNLTVLSEELVALTKSAQQEVKAFSGIASAVKSTARDSNELVRTSNELVTTLNQVVLENRSNIDSTLTRVNTTLSSIQQTSNEIKLLAVNLQETSDRATRAIDPAQTQQVLANVTAVTDNAVKITQELQQISTTLNDPTSLVVLQETIDSARATFQNAQKITADLEDFTGDPDFRRNLKRLVNGLSQLVSTTEQFQQQVHIAKVLEPATEQVNQMTPSSIAPTTLTPPAQETSNPSTPTPNSHTETVSAPLPAAATPNSPSPVENVN